MTEFHSVRADLWGALNGDLSVDGSMRRAAQLRKDLNEAQKTLDRLCQRIVEGREEGTRTGIDATQRLSLPLQAYFGAWQRENAQPRRVEITQLGEAPIGPESR